MAALPVPQQTMDRARNLGTKLEEHIFAKATNRVSYHQAYYIEILIFDFKQNYFQIVFAQIQNWQRGNY